MQSFSSRSLTAFVLIYLACNSITVAWVYKGSDIDRVDYPALGKLTSMSGGLCTAFLISDVFAVTAAHCITYMGKTGLRFLSLNGESASVIKVEVKTHTLKPIANDIAIVKLEKPIKLDRYFEIKTTDTPFTAKEKVTLMGYGGAPTDLPTRGVLQFSHMQTSGVGAGLATFLSLNRAGAISCKGDSGGPVLAMNSSHEVTSTVVGIISGGAYANPLARCEDALNTFAVPIALHHAWVNSMIAKMNIEPITKPARAYKVWGPYQGYQYVVRYEYTSKETKVNFITQTSPTMTPSYYSIGAVTYPDAEKSCDSLIWAGMRGWRLPKKKELHQMIEDFGRIKNDNIGEPGRYFWTSTTLLPGENGYSAKDNRVLTVKISTGDLEVRSTQYALQQETSFLLCVHE